MKYGIFNLAGVYLKGLKLNYVKLNADSLKLFVEKLLAFLISLFFKYIFYD